MESQLYTILQASINNAMKMHDTIKRDCLRCVISEVKNQTVNAGKDITDDACLKVLQKSLKMHNDSIAQFEAAGREDLAAKEKAEVEVLEAFLPKMMSASEVEELVEKTIGQLASQFGHGLSKKDMGAVMKVLSSSPLAPSIDMKLASKAAAQRLS